MIAKMDIPTSENFKKYLSISSDISEKIEGWIELAFNESEDERELETPERVLDVKPFTRYNRLMFF